jgi:hypothetical protein
MVGNLPFIEKEELVSPERSFAVLYDVPLGEQKEVYERMCDDIRDKFNELRLNFFQQPRDLQSFFNLDLNQHEFYSKTLEIARNSLDNFAQNNIGDGRVFTMV